MYRADFSAAEYHLNKQLLCYTPSSAGDAIRSRLVLENILERGNPPIRL